jgi:hypothetical protein
MSKDEQEKWGKEYSKMINQNRGTKRKKQLSISRRNKRAECRNYSLHQ